MCDIYPQFLQKCKCQNNGLKKVIIIRVSIWPNPLIYIKFLIEYNFFLIWNCFIM